MLEFNARNQVTLWGPPLFVPNKQHTATNPGNPQDYAGKTWAGLFSSYYQPRQQLFMSMLQDAVSKAAAQQNGGGSVCHGL
jgi:alpha-N-acetylglucosaminidase